MPFVSYSSHNVVENMSGTNRLAKGFAFEFGWVIDGLFLFHNEVTVHVGFQ
jgi:hypothetical protein